MQEIDYMSQLPNKPTMAEQTKQRKKEYAKKMNAERVAKQRESEREKTRQADANLQEVLARMKQRGATG